MNLNDLIKAEVSIVSIQADQSRQVGAGSPSAHSAGVSIVSIQADQSRLASAGNFYKLMADVSIVSIQADQSRLMHLTAFPIHWLRFNRINSGRSIPTRKWFLTLNRRVLVSIVSIQADQSRRLWRLWHGSASSSVSIVSIQADQSRPEYVRTNNEW